MALCNSFDKEKRAVLNPENVYEKVEGFPKTCLITFNKKIEEIFVKKYGAKEIAHLYGGGNIPVYEADGLGLFKTHMGAPITVAFMEELRAMGAEKFVVFGSCGVLDEAIKPGHIIVPTKAYRDEGTSYHYLKEADSIQVETSNRLIAILESLDVAYIKTGTWTTDGLYRETKRNMDERLKDGYLVVDMECSAIMAFAKFRDIQAYQFLYAEDSLGDGNWQPRNMGKIMPKEKEEYLDIAIKIAKAI
ncbi:MAG: nucleoside phosphorylase [Clostridia bacterium]|nr:nucleoside phosphorylase [Clostridia bacterium]